MITFKNAKKRGHAAAATVFAGFLLINGMSVSASESIKAPETEAAVAGAVFEQAQAMEDSFASAGLKMIAVEGDEAESKVVAVAEGTVESKLETVGDSGNNNDKTINIDGASEAGETAGEGDMTLEEAEKKAEELIAEGEDAAVVMNRGKLEDIKAAAAEDSAESEKAQAAADQSDKAADAADESDKAQDAAEESEKVQEAAETETASENVTESEQAASEEGTEGEITYSEEAQAESAGITYEVPNYSGNKSYESYRVIRRGKAGTLQTLASTNADGFRMVNGRYLVAVGTYFGASRGQYIDLTLENGTVIPCIVGDMKAAPIFSANGCCSEFIVDTQVIKNVISSGDVSDYRSEWDSPVDSVTVLDEYAL